VHSVAQAATAFGKSNFTNGIISALLGTFVGAFGAHFLAQKDARRQELLNEIRNTNAAIMVAVNICISALLLKSDSVKPMRGIYDKKSKIFEEYINAVVGTSEGKISASSFEPDLEQLSISPWPVDILRGILFEKLSLANRPLMAISTLEQQIHQLNASLEFRNKKIEEFKNLDRNHLIFNYYGFEISGITNQEYRSSIKSIYDQVDDCIYYSNLIYEDLVFHGMRLKDKFYDKFGSGAPKINTVTHTDLTQKELFPDRGLYREWEENFTPMQTYMLNDVGLLPLNAQVDLCFDA
jgi:hypothetical protein